MTRDNELFLKSLHIRVTKNTKKFFFPPQHSSQTGSGTHSTSYSMSTGALSPGVKQLEHKAGHSLTTSANVKNEWNYVFTPYTISWHGT
jgi:hypothetical protein